MVPKEIIQLKNNDYLRSLKYESDYNFGFCLNIDSLL